VNPYVKAIQRTAFDSIGLIAIDMGPITNMLINVKKSKFFFYNQCCQRYGLCLELIEI
jgi:hypothetical protein